MPDITPAAMRLADVTVPQFTITAASSTTTEEIDELMVSAEKRRNLEVLARAKQLDDAGVREAVEDLTVGSSGHEDSNLPCPFCKSALAALNRTE